MKEFDYLIGKKIVGFEFISRSTTGPYSFKHKKVFNKIGTILNIKEFGDRYETMCLISFVDEHNIVECYYPLKDVLKQPCIKIFSKKEIDELFNKIQNL